MFLPSHFPQGFVNYIWGLECYTFTLYVSIVDRVKLLEREVTKKDKALASIKALLSALKGSLSTAQGDLENLRFENNLLAKKMDEVSDTSLASVSDSFENTLLQVEHFNSLLHILRD